jgi:hypothetical protein
MLHLVIVFGSEIIEKVDLLGVSLSLMKNACKSIFIIKISVLFAWHR